MCPSNPALQKVNHYSKMGWPLKRGYTFLLGHTIKFNIPESKPLFENGLAAEAGLKFLLSHTINFKTPERKP